MKRNHIFWASAIAFCSALIAAILPFHANAATQSERPNILWIFIDDQDPRYSCYGETLIQTPNIDALAAEGVRFERAYAPNPVCAPSRSAIITGSYAIRLGTHNMRSGRMPGAEIYLPEGFETIPELFRKAGYATFNRGKDDYNFIYDRSDLHSIGNVSGLLNGGVKSKGLRGQGDWSEVPEGTSFFGQIQPPGGKFTRGIAEHLKELGVSPVDPASVTVPPQYPDIPEIRDALANHLNKMVKADHEVGLILDRLKADGLWENTIIFLFSDHGSDMPRSKEFCYEEGLRVPLIIAGPGMKNIVKPGTVREDLTTLLDVGATSLALAGLDVPAHYDSKNIFAKDYKRDHIFFSRDRMSMAIDRVRAIRGDRYHYKRNFMTDRLLMQQNYRTPLPLSMKLQSMYDHGKLTPGQAMPYGKRPAEELYDMEKDPHQTVNLAQSSDHEAALLKMRGLLTDWIGDTGDKGMFPESRGALQAVKNRLGNQAVAPEFDGFVVEDANLTYESYKDKTLKKK